MAYRRSSVYSSSRNWPYFDFKEHEKMLRNEAAAMGITLSEYLTYKEKQRPDWCWTVSERLGKCERKRAGGSYECQILAEWLLECKEKKKVLFVEASQRRPYSDSDEIEKKARNEAATAGLTLSDYLTNKQKQHPNWCKMISKRFGKCERKDESGSYECDILRAWLRECNEKKKNA